jgi:hypothetical protein
MPGYRAIAHDAVPAADWVPAAFINMNWWDFAKSFGVQFVPNDGTYEAPGPVAYAAVKLETGEIFPFEHHFDSFGSRVIVYLRRGSDYESSIERLMQELGISGDLITRSDGIDA